MAADPSSMEKSNIRRKIQYSVQKKNTFYVYKLQRRLYSKDITEGCSRQLDQENRRHAGQTLFWDVVQHWQTCQQINNPAVHCKVQK